MDRKSLLNEFSYKLRKLRSSLGYGSRKMAGFLGTGKTNYYRYENGKVFPGFWGLRSIANSLGISLDWLVCGKGPMYYKEVREEKEEGPSAPGVKTADKEIKNLVESMERIPLLRHETDLGVLSEKALNFWTLLPFGRVLAYFYS
jgi:transcriptional regulator with XRE-family HTH domain